MLPLLPPFSFALLSSFPKRCRSTQMHPSAVQRSLSRRQALAQSLVPPHDLVFSSFPSSCHFFCNVRLLLSSSRRLRFPRSLIFLARSVYATVLTEPASRAPLLLTYPLRCHVRQRQHFFFLHPPSSHVSRRSARRSILPPPSLKSKSMPQTHLSEVTEDRFWDGLAIDVTTSDEADTVRPSARLSLRAQRSALRL